VCDSGSDGPWHPIKKNYSAGCLRTIDLKRMRQGELDDCPLPASVIVLIEYADLIRLTFTESVENRVAALDIDFYRMGEWKSITVDSRVLFKNSKPNFMRPVTVVDSG
jgi:hypothetical protein